MNISIVIPVLNEEVSIGATLESLFSQSLKASEIVIADAGSTDRTLEVIDSYRNSGIPILVVKNPKRLPGAGRNAAIFAASHEFIACMDAGNIAEPDWLKELARPFGENDTQVDAVYGRFLPMPRSDFEECVASVIFCGLYACVAGVKEINSSSDMSIPFSGSSLLFRRSAWQRAGMFPDWLRTSEDKLFGKKLLKAGCKVFFNSRASIYTHVRRNTRQLFRQIFYYGVGNGQSRQTPKGLRHLLIKYGAGLIALGASFVYPHIFLFLALCAGFYTYRQGYTSYIRIYNRFPEGGRIFIIPVVLFTRDLGTIFGNFYGFWQRYRNPAYRKMLSEYYNCP